MKVFLNDINVTNDIINEEIEFSSRYLPDSFKFEISDVRLKLSCLRTNYFEIVDNSDEIFVKILNDDGKTIFFGFVSQQGWSFDAENFTLEINVISRDREFWDKVETLTMKDLKSDYLFYTYTNTPFGLIRIPKLFIAWEDICAMLSSLTGFNIKAGYLSGKFVSNDESFGLRALSDEMTIKDFILGVLKFYNLVLRYEPEENSLQFVQSKINTDKELKASGIVNSTLSSIGHFYNFIFVPADIVKADKPEIVEYFLSDRGLYMATKYKYILVYELSNGFYSAPSDVTEFTTPISFGGFPRVSLRLKLPKTTLNVKKRYLYRASPYTYPMFEPNKFYLVSVIEGSDETIFTDNIDDQERFMQTMSEQIQGFYYYLDESGAWRYVTEKPKTGKILEIAPNFRFVAGDKEVRNLSYTLMFFEPLGVDFADVLNRFRFLLSEFYVIRAKFSKLLNNLNLQINEHLKIDDLKKVVKLLNSSGFALVVEVVESANDVEVELWTEKIKPKFMTL